MPPAATSVSVPAPDSRAQAAPVAPPQAQAQAAPVAPPAVPAPQVTVAGPQPAATPQVTTSTAQPNAARHATAPASTAWSATTTRQEAQANAAAVATTAPISAAPAAATPTTSSAQQVSTGTVYNGREQLHPDGDRGSSGALDRLRIGSHLASHSSLAQLRISTTSSGLILGADRQQRPVTVRFFQPEPLRAALVGGTWAGQLVAFRALALGARVMVITAEPGAWQGFGDRVTGRNDRVAVLSVGHAQPPAGTPHQPLLIVHDPGPTGTVVAAPQQLGPWQTQLTILRQLDEAGVPSVQQCGLVLLQRLANAEANLAATTLRLPGPSVQFLQVMADDMVALVADGSDRYMWFAQTDIERQHTGAPRR